MIRRSTRRGARRTHKVAGSDLDEDIPRSRLGLGCRADLEGLPRLDEAGDLNLDVGHGG